MDKAGMLAIVSCSVLLIFTGIPPARAQQGGPNDPVVKALMCMQNATTCLAQVYAALGIDMTNMNTFTPQLMQLAQGNLLKPWTETCAQRDTVFSDAPFNCYQQHLSACMQLVSGLPPQQSMSLTVTAQASQSLRHFCAPGCENLQERMHQNRRCIVNITSAMENPTSIQESEKPAFCSSAQSAIACSARAAQGCAFTTKSIETQLPMMQQGISAVVQPVPCPLQLPSPEVTSAAPATEAPPPAATTAPAPNPESSTVSGASLFSMHMATLLSVVGMATLSHVSM